MMVDREDLPVLDRFSEVVAEHYSDALFTVEGFTDRAGSVEYNLALGQRRAEAVRTYLINGGGFPAERVRAVSYGEAPNRMVSPGLAGRGVGIENRRVALVVEHIGLLDVPEILAHGEDFDRRLPVGAVVHAFDVMVEPAQGDLA